jgi:hypothetical protein
LISSLMMPACTGLPPGELISSTTPCAPTSSKRCAWPLPPLRRWQSPVRVDFSLDLDHRRVRQRLVGSDLALPHQRPQENTKKASQASRMKLRQRRAVRCSWSVASISFSSVRSQPGG